MFGIVVGKPVEYLKLNGDKNYLTPLELAALVDNHLIEITTESVRDFCIEHSIPLDGEGAAKVISETVRLARSARDD